MRFYFGSGNLLDHRSAVDGYLQVSELVRNSYVTDGAIIFVAIQSLQEGLSSCYFGDVKYFALSLWNEEGFASQLFWGIGLFGLFLIVLQAVFGLFVGHDGDTSTGGGVDVHGGHGGGSNYLSLKSVSALLLGLGFGGAILDKNGYSVGISALGGIVIGVAIGATYVALMNSLYRLRSDGTAVLSDAINRSGTVYMRIPAGMSASGEIQVSFGGRLQNIKAYTRGLELPTGTSVRVIALYGDHALIVEKLS